MLHHRRAPLFAAAAALVLVTAACGNSKDAAGAGAGASGGAVKVQMVDIAYKPTELKVAKGKDIRFVFENRGKLKHEAFLGTPAEQKDHDTEMQAGGSSSGMGTMSGGSKTAIEVAPGKTGEFTTRFDEAGTYEIGCHEPGHYAAGMKITLTVS